MSWRSSSAWRNGTATAGTVEHGSNANGGPTRKLVEVVGVRAFAARVHDQLHGPPNARERSRPHHETIQPAPGAIWKSGVCLWLGFRSGLNSIRNARGSSVGALDLSNCFVRVVRDRISHWLHHQLQGADCVSNAAWILRGRPLALRHQNNAGSARSK